MRIYLGLIGALLVLELILMPWTGHLYDTSVFFITSEYVFFVHTPPGVGWPFGPIGLAAVLASQLPVLFFPSLSTAYNVRLLFLKLPSWLADIGTAAIVRYVSSGAANGNYWALRYLLDPIVVLTTVFHGQWDAIPNLFAVAGIAAMLTGRFDLAAIAFGLGAGTKFYPAAFVPLLFVVVLRRTSMPQALRTVGWFALTAAVTLLPLFWNGLRYALHAYSFNSFGPGQGVFTVSLWSLVPNVGLSTRLEQLVAVAIPVLLAALELRHVPQKRDVARTAMFTAMSIVLLNPGAHPPFYLWIAGPLVLYCAVANDALTSIGGLLLSLTGVLTQFCLEGSDEYFLLSIGAAPREPVLRCVASPQHLQWAVVACVVWIVLTSYRDVVESAWDRAARVCAASLAIIVAGLFFWQIAAGISSARSNPKKVAYGLRRDRFEVFGLAPVKRQSGRDCLLTYDSYGGAAFAGIPYSAQFVTARLGYSLYTRETLVIRGRSIDVSRLPSRYGGEDLDVYEDREVRVTRQFDVTRLLRPFSEPITMVERPCSLIPKNPVLVYSIDLDAARAAAAAQPLLQRIDFLAQGDDQLMEIDRSQQ